jgi:DCN1-like protein 1/2
LDKQKAHLKDLKQNLSSSKDDFTKVYNYTFQVAKAPQSKNISPGDATTYWELLFASPLAAVKWSTQSSPWLTWWLEYVKSKFNKAINKDIWSQTLKFAQMTLEDEAMSFWNEDASWPSVIDEFVEWVKTEKRGGATADAMEE